MSVAPLHEEAGSLLIPSLPRALPDGEEQPCAGALRPDGAEALRRDEHQDAEEPLRAADELQEEEAEEPSPAAHDREDHEEARGDEQPGRGQIASTWLTPERPEWRCGAHGGSADARPRPQPQQLPRHSPPRGSPTRRRTDRSARCAPRCRTRRHRRRPVRLRLRRHPRTRWCEARPSQAPERRCRSP